MKPTTLAILCALPQEFDGVLSQLSSYEACIEKGKRLAKGTFDGYSILVYETGLGSTNSAITTTRILERENPDFLFFCGIAGGLEESLSVGDVIAAQMIFQAGAETHAEFAEHWPAPVVDMQSNELLLSLAKKLERSSSNYSIHTGNIVSSENFPVPENLLDLFSKKKTLAIDMESCAFYQTCLYYDKPCLAIRGISNPVTDGDIKIDDILVSAKNAAEVLFHLIKLIPKDSLKQNSTIDCVPATS